MPTYKSGRDDFWKLPPNFELLADFKINRNLLSRKSRAYEITKAMKEAWIPELRAQLVREQHDRYYPLLLEILRGTHSRYAAEKRRAGGARFFRS